MVVRKLVHENLIINWAKENLVVTENSEEYLKDLYSLYKNSVTFPENCCITTKKDFHFLLNEVVNHKLKKESNIEKVTSAGSKQGVIFSNLSIKE